MRGPPHGPLGWALALALLAGGCGLAGDVEAGSSLGSDFGTPEASLSELDAEAVGDLMTTVLLRHRMYSALRGALPLELLINGTGCHSNVEQVAGVYAFESAMSCAVPEPLSAGQVLGDVAFDQGNAAGGFVINLEYLGVSVPGVTVEGTERVTESPEGTTEVVLDLVQDAFDFDYAFRMEMLAEGSPAFDYELDSPDGVVFVRLTNPPTVGAFATVTLVGVDGSVTCEIRDAAWSPGAAARGTCEDGTVFGL